MVNNSLVGIICKLTVSLQAIPSIIVVRLKLAGQDMILPGRDKNLTFRSRLM